MELKSNVLLLCWDRVFCSSPGPPASVSLAERQHPWPNWPHCAGALSVTVPANEGKSIPPAAPLVEGGMSPPPAEEEGVGQMLELLPAALSQLKSLWCTEKEVILFAMHRP